MACLISWIGHELYLYKMLAKFYIVFAEDLINNEQMWK